MSSVDELMDLVHTQCAANHLAGREGLPFERVGMHAIRYAAESLASGMAQWQDIATAPKDGVFLVFMPQERPDDQIQVAKWHPNVKVIGGCFAFDRKPVTHFYALPPPPLSASPEDKPK